jgi:hypothetical protein
MMELRQLTERYRQVAARYAQVYGPPPAMPAAAGELVAVTRQMVEALNGRRAPEAGEPVAVGHEVTLAIEASGPVFEITADIDLLDAAGQRAGCMRVSVDDEQGKALVDDLVSHIRGRAILAFDGRGNP